jgi:DNA mismatch endonuclease (patch repair protein)
MDRISTEARSALMSKVRGKDTTPEMTVRRLSHRLGYRYRLHAKELPGHPDLVFPSRRKVIFVNGCFWHRHRCSSGRETPKSRMDFWLPKLERNRKRDIENQRRLRRMGWDVLVIWECQTRSLSSLEAKVTRFLVRH